VKVIASNRKAGHEYFFLESHEVGIVLTGTEIKSVRAGKVSLSDTYCRVRNGELYVLNMHIAKYDQGNLFNHEETRERKLLMHRNEILRLGMRLKTEGLTLVPTKVYLKEGLCKLEIALAKGKKQYDKREVKKAEDVNRRLRKALKNVGADE
jgi:SsrA-binding protein